MIIVYMTISQDEMRMLIIDIVARYPHSLCYIVLQCNMQFD